MTETFLKELTMGVDKGQLAKALKEELLKSDCSDFASLADNDVQSEAERLADRVMADFDVTPRAPSVMDTSSKSVQDAAKRGFKS